jgi:16S rRNA G527 N7-methylase RsmG
LQVQRLSLQHSLCKHINFFPCAAGSKTDGNCSGPAVTVVDFGSGSGSLTLPLAWLFPSLTFLAVDKKAAAIAHLQQSAMEAGLNNVEAVTLSIEQYRCGPCCHATLHVNVELSNTTTNCSVSLGMSE